MWSLLYLLPKNHVSRLIGWLVSHELPFGLSRTLLRYFVRTFPVDLEEAAEELDRYRTLGEFFVRDLRPGVRPVGEGVVSPVDGTITEFGPCSGETLLQVKGRNYSLRKLLRDDELTARFRGGFYITIYLAPHDYHQIHAPVTGAVSRMVYIPGALWPVNSWSINNIDELFTVNERIITVLDAPAGGVAVVKVGATNVGCISLVYDNLRSNCRMAGGGADRVVQRSYEGLILEKGAKLAAFNLGSTVLLLFEPGKFVPGPGCVRGPVRLGTSLGRLVDETTHG